MKALLFVFVIAVPPPSPGVRKYVLWCLLCGGAAGLLGIMFLGVYFLIRNYTSSVTYFETVPTFVPSTLVSLSPTPLHILPRKSNSNIRGALFECGDSDETYTSTDKSWYVCVPLFTWQTQSEEGEKRSSLRRRRISGRVVRQIKFPAEPSSPTTRRFNSVLCTEASTFSSPRFTHLLGN